MLRTVTLKVIDSGSATCWSKRWEIKAYISLICTVHKDRCISICQDLIRNSILELKKKKQLYETFIEKSCIFVKRIGFTNSTFSDKKCFVKIILTTSFWKRQKDNLLWHYLKDTFSFASHLASETSQKNWYDSVTLERYQSFREWHFSLWETS